MTVADHQRVDVIVADGFTGNVALKTAEGTARLLGHYLRESFKHSFWGKLGYLFARPAISRFRGRTDPRRYNGAMFLGLNGIAVKSHGGTDAVGFAQAIKVAAGMGESSFRAEVEENLRRLAPAQPPPSPAEQAVQ